MCKGGERPRERPAVELLPSLGRATCLDDEELRAKFVRRHQEPVGLLRSTNHPPSLLALVVPTLTTLCRCRPFLSRLAQLCPCH